MNYRSVEEAVDIILSNVEAPTQWEEASLPLSAGRVCARDLCARHDHPPFHRSPLDGYAVYHKDIQNAGPKTPITLTVSQQIYAGDAPGFPVVSGCAAKIATGAPIPLGATCVVRHEDTRFDECSVTIYQSHREYENFCFSGEDVAKGQLLVRKGQRLGSAEIGVLAGQGYVHVPVFRQPQIGVLSTGNELQPSGEPLRPGKIYDSNGHILSARAAMLGAIPQYRGPWPDDPGFLADELARLAKETDLVIVTGGVSAGERDYLPHMPDLLGAELLFHGVSLKPGSPALAMRRNNKVLLCLSGNPFAATATFELLAVPAIKRLLGAGSCLWERAQGILQDSYPKPSHTRRFVRGKIVGDKVYIPTVGHESGSLSSLMGCNCLIDIPQGAQALKPGQRVTVVLFE